MNKLFLIKTKNEFKNNHYEKMICENFNLDVCVDEILVYKIFNLQDESQAQYILDNILLDNYTNIEISNLDEYETYFGFKLHDNQYCKRSESVKQCFNLMYDNEIKVVFGSVLAFDKKIDLSEIEKTVINVVDSIKMDLSMEETKISNPKFTLNNFDLTNYTTKMLLDLKNELNIGLDILDLELIKERNPIINELELRVLDTYWSDHCRHTTFMTNLTNIKIEDNQINNVYLEYLNMKKETNQKPITLMDIACLNASYLKSKGLLESVEVSKEVNACSVYVTLEDEKWLMMFKNETHNHPTEIEPYGGAATCVGGAIRDPLSGRSYVYQAIRIAGSGNPYESIEKTLPNKLSQQKISIESCLGYSSYGNQIGLATSLVKEIYDESYKAKHMELGAVMGANKASNVLRLEPCDGDYIILLGGRTGKDGIGGATGSSLVQDDNSIHLQSAQVQKGNAIIERKLQRLYRNETFSKLIKRSNDFGAGGVCVAIGELADGIDVYLDKVKLKYQNLNPMDIALSESQERMAIVIDHNDYELIKTLCDNEGVEYSHVATVTNKNQLVFYYQDEILLKLNREFLDCNGATRYQDVTVEKQKEVRNLINANLLDRLSHPLYASQKSLNEYFDCSVGHRSALNPYGGQYMLTPEDVSVMYFPKKDTRKVSSIAYGFESMYAKQNPFISSYYSVITSISKLIASGVNLNNIHLSFQEYFKSLQNDPLRWQEPFVSLLGAFKALTQFNKAAIGGKDSMSGTYNEIDVIPTLVSFAFSESDYVISSCLKKKNSKLYLIRANYQDNLVVEDDLIKKYNLLYEYIKQDKVLSSRSIDSSGLFTSLSIMSFGNKIGFEINDSNPYDHNLGSIIVESEYDLDFELIGHTNESDLIICNNEKFNIETAIKAYHNLETKLYGQDEYESKPLEYNSSFRNDFKYPNPTNDVKVVIPVFTGTNSEDDVALAFEKAGASVKQVIINNNTKQSLDESLTKLANEISNSHIIALAGGFSLEDEPDGSGKFIANILKTPIIKDVIDKHLADKKLMIGICNGFQALVKAGYLPGENIKATLYKNECQRHIQRLVHTRITSINSPWLSINDLNTTNLVPISHGEGRFLVSEEDLEVLKDNHQIFSMYVSKDNELDMKDNPNQSTFNIEGLTSKDGLILGKMAHNERIDDHLFMNVEGNKKISIFENGIKYIKGE